MSGKSAQSFELPPFSESMIKSGLVLHRIVHSPLLVSLAPANQFCVLTLRSGSRIVRSMSELVAYIDGGSHGNPGPSGIGVVIEGAVSGPIRISKSIGHQDSNVAEYVALMEALQCALLLKARQIHVYSDSEVVVNQMIGIYKCRSPRLYSLNWVCRKLARSLQFSMSHVGRQLNAEANYLANLAITKP